MTSTETLDMFRTAVNEVANGPKVTSFQNLTESLLRRLSEKGLTLEECTSRKMLNRSTSTLQKHCREYGIRFPDYTPSNMRNNVRFEPVGDFMVLSGDLAEAVSEALQVDMAEIGGQRCCAIPLFKFEAAKKNLRRSGYVVRAAKPAKAKEKSNA